MIAEGHAGSLRAVHPFESPTRHPPKNTIDTLVLASLRQRRIMPARVCSDAVFIRRAHLDVIGTLPEPSAVRAFLRDTRPKKRAELVEALMRREEFADYWSLKWCDLLRVKAEFPINLWPNAVQAYQARLARTVRELIAQDHWCHVISSAVALDHPRHERYHNSSKDAHLQIADEYSGTTA
ncbi:DUF1549 domain-containing protein [Planctomycetota bacterium]